MTSTRRCVIWLTVILALTLGLAASTMAGVEPVDDEDPVDVRLVPGSGMCLPGVGERMIVDVMVYDVEHLNGAELYIEYDPQVLQVIDAEAGEEGIQISAGDLFAPYGRAQLRTVDDENNIIVYVHQLGDFEISGTGSIARIIFEVLEESTTTLSFVDAGPTRPNWLALHPDYRVYPVGRDDIPATWYDRQLVDGCHVLYLPVSTKGSSLTSPE